MNLQSTGVLLTGASAGLGAAMARRLAARGARVVLVARSGGALEEIVGEIRAEGGKAWAISADVGSKEDVYAIAGAAQELAGDIALVVHNASLLGDVPLRLLADTACEDVERVLAVNLIGPFRLTKALVGPMLLRGHGLVLHVSSDAAVVAYPRWGAYSASKAALDHMSRIWAAELEGTGVRFLGVDPGEMDTAMHAAAMPDADRSALQRPADVALRIVDMIEDESWSSGSRLEAQSWEGVR
jgi:NAD(P)-dependent dehydrogenase (short-subunit alcohol dehydrogenase family)